MKIVKGIRPLDCALAVVMVALAAVIGYEDVAAGTGADLAHAMDSHSPWIVPVSVLAALPILWRRRYVLPAIGGSFAVLAASVVAFGWITRCGLALPLAIAFAYAVARFAGRGQSQVLGLVGVVAVQVVTLVRDSSTGGLAALGNGLPLAAVAYGIGRFVQTRAAKALQTPTLSVEPVHG
jgi:hypothetical protein